MHIYPNKIIPTLLFLATFGSSASFAENYILERVISNPTPASGERFGQSVDVENNIIAIGAPLDDFGATNSGVVHLYDANTGLLLDTISNPTPQDHDSFGSEVVISGNLLTIGSTNDKTVGGIPHGSVYLYDLSSNLLATILDPNPASENHFGTAIGFDGQGFVTSSQLFDAGGLNNIGTGYFYDIGALTVPIPLSNPGPSILNEDRYGSAVALSANHIAIAKTGLQLGSAIAGSVDIYDRTNFSLIQTIVSPDSSINDQFGRQVVLKNSRLLIASPHTEISAHAGSVYLYEFDSNSGQFALSQTINNPFPADGDLFGGYEGGSIALVNDLVIAASLNDDNQGTNSGEVYVFSAVTGDLIQTISNPDSSPANDNFSWSLAAKNDLLAISAVSDEAPGFNASGTVYVYKLSTESIPHLHCWDLNENGEEDPLFEDINGDGVVDVFDCTGPIGPPGQDGSDGIDGTDGLSCWDLNGDGVQDPVEDVNGDGLIDILDCAGPKGESGIDGADGQDGAQGIPGIDGADGQDGAQGIPGIDGADGQDGAQGFPGIDGADGQDGAQGIPGDDGTDGLSCWDLNGDGVQDPVEDVNGDGLIDILDCAGPKGESGIDGADGQDGIDGTNGQDGIDGTNGQDGIDGTNGQDGIDGTNGQDGIDGTNGLSCWDLNENGVPDAEEDINSDSVVNVMDCNSSTGTDQYFINSPTSYIVKPGPANRVDIEETCPNGAIAVGGGIAASRSGARFISIFSSFPKNIHTWQATVDNTAPKGNKGRPRVRLFLTCKLP